MADPFWAGSCLLNFGEERSASARFDQGANFNVGFNPAREADTNSMSALKTGQAPFISADTRGCDAEFFSGLTLRPAPTFDVFAQGGHKIRTHGENSRLRLVEPQTHCGWQASYVEYCVCA